MTTLQTLEDQLRSAVESRQFVEVERLVVEYANAARGHMASLTPGSTEAREAQAAIQGTLEWSQRMVQAGRESIALELNRLPRVKRYLQMPPGNGSPFRIEG